MCEVNSKLAHRKAIEQFPIIPPLRERSFEALRPGLLKAEEGLSLASGNGRLRLQVGIQQPANRRFESLVIQGKLEQAMGARGHQ